MSSSPAETAQTAPGRLPAVGGDAPAAVDTLIGTFEQDLGPLNGARDLRCSGSGVLPSHVVATRGDDDPVELLLLRR